MRGSLPLAAAALAVVLCCCSSNNGLSGLSERMREPLMKGLFLMMGVALLACGCGGGSSFVGGSDEGQVRALFNQQQNLLHDKNWRELYQTYSPAFQDECSYSQFLKSAQATSASGVSWDNLDYANLKIRVSGSKAYLTYTVTYGGENVHVASEEDPDIFIRISGRWYDEVDSHTECY